MKIFKKEHEVTDLAIEFLDASQRCVSKAEAAVVRYLQGEVDGMQELVREVSDEETEADRILREMRDLLFSGAYLPLIRADIYSLLDSIDGLPNAAESCCRFFYSERPEVPEEFRERFIKVTEHSFGIFQQLDRSASGFFKPKEKMESIRHGVKVISTEETVVDTLEVELIVAIFGSPSLGLAEKSHLRRALSHIVEISDRAEDSADQLLLIAMKAIA